jgi:hypothetical protein
MPTWHPLSTKVGNHFADKQRSLVRCSSLSDSDHGVFFWSKALAPSSGLESKLSKMQVRSQSAVAALLLRSICELEYGFSTILRKVSKPYQTTQFHNVRDNKIRGEAVLVLN